MLSAANRAIASTQVLRCRNNYKPVFVGPVTEFSYSASLGSVMTMHKQDAQELQELFGEDLGYELFPVV